MSPIVSWTCPDGPQIPPQRLASPSVSYTCVEHPCAFGGLGLESPVAIGRISRQPHRLEVRFGLGTASKWHFFAFLEQAEHEPYEAETRPYPTREYHDLARTGRGSAAGCTAESRQENHDGSILL